MLPLKVVYDLARAIVTSGVAERCLNVSAGIKHPHYCRFCLWESRPIIAREHTNALAPAGASGDCSRTSGRSCLADTRPSCAVSRNRNIGTASVVGVRPDRFDHQVESIDAVDLARYGVRLIRRNKLGCEVVQAIDALGVAVRHQEHRARPILRPRELDHLAQARW